MPPNSRYTFGCNKAIHCQTYYLGLKQFAGYKEQIQIAQSRNYQNNHIWGKMSLGHEKHSQKYVLDKVKSLFFLLFSLTLRPYVDFGLLSHSKPFCSFKEHPLQFLTANVFRSSSTHAIHRLRSLLLTLVSVGFLSVLYFSIHP